MFTRYVLGLFFALAAAVVICVMILPKSKDGTFNNGFLQQLHDYFQFKQLYIEVMLKVLFVLGTCLCVFVGFFLLFGRSFGTGLILMLLGPLVLRVIYEFAMMLVLLVQNTMEINRKLSGAPDKAEQAHSANESSAPSAPRAEDAAQGFVARVSPLPDEDRSPIAEETPVESAASQTSPAAVAAFERLEPTSADPGAPVVRFCPNCGTRYDAAQTHTCPACGMDLS